MALWRRLFRAKEKSSESAASDQPTTDPVRPDKQPKTDDSKTDAMSRFTRMEQLARDQLSKDPHADARQREVFGFGQKDFLALSLSRQAAGLYKQRDFEGALSLYREAEHHWRELATTEETESARHNRAMLTSCLYEKAATLFSMGWVNESYGAAEEAHRLAVREMLTTHEQHISQLLGIVRTRFMQMERQARDRLRDDPDAEARQREGARCGQQELLALNLKHQADEIFDQQDFEGALRLYSEAEQLCRQIATTALTKSARHKQAMLASCLYEKAATLFLMGRLNESCATAEEAHALAMREDLTAYEQRLLELLRIVRAGLGR